MVVWFVWDSLGGGGWGAQGRELREEGWEAFMDKKKLEANGKCKTFWSFFFFFHSASICRRLVLAPSPACRASLRTLLTRSAPVSVQLTMLCEGCLPLQTLAKIMCHTNKGSQLSEAERERKIYFWGTFNNLSQPHVKN